MIHDGRPTRDEAIRLYADMAQGLAVKRAKRLGMKLTREDREDLNSEALVCLLECVDQYDGRIPFRAYVSLQVRFMVREFYRSHERSRRWRRDGRSSHTAEATVIPSETEPSPANLALDRALMGLDQTERAIINLYYLSSSPKTNRSKRERTVAAYQLVGTTKTGEVVNKVLRKLRTALSADESLVAA